MPTFPENLQSLHAQEEKLREKAMVVVSGNDRLFLHLEIVEQAMNLADLLRQYDAPDEDLKVVQILGMRMFNAFGAGLKLALSGYIQNAALIMRDILETTFLVDLFSGDRTQIAVWRLGDKKTIDKEFKPIRVREKLDSRDGFSGQKRAEVYRMFSELAGHPNTKSVHMMRPRPNHDAVIGPFVEATSLEAVLSEMGRLAVQVGEHLSRFFPENWPDAREALRVFGARKIEWISKFYPQSLRGRRTKEARPFDANT